jgi:hypothetical protein
MKCVESGLLRRLGLRRAEKFNNVTEGEVIINLPPYIAVAYPDSRFACGHTFI